jgi:hypothetical protein
MKQNVLNRKHLFFKNMKYLLTFIKNEILLRRFTPNVNPGQNEYKGTDEYRNGYKIFKIVFQRYN